MINISIDKETLIKYIEDHHNIPEKYISNKLFHLISDNLLHAINAILNNSTKDVYDIVDDSVEYALYMIDHHIIESIIPKNLSIILFFENLFDTLQLTYKIDSVKIIE